MSNTLKFGNGKWAVKENSALAYNDENGNFKPLPFTFDRSTSATRVNKEGLIEVVSNNEPRIDFLNDSNGALLLEPSRTNLVTYSEDFSEWNTIQATLTSEYGVSPDGTSNSTRCVFATSNRALEFTVSTSSAIATIYVKGTSGETIQFGTNGAEQLFTFTGDWQRLEKYNSSSISRVTLNTYAGATARDFEIWGSQIEAGSYATSYIPTQGSIGTRVAESCEQTPPSGIIGQTEGTVFIEGTAILDANGSMPFTIYLNSSNILYAWFRTNGIIDIDVFASGLFQDRIRTSVGTISNGDYFKLSVAYKSNDLVAYLNGVQIGTANPSLIPSCSSLIIGGYIATSYSGSLIKETKLYNTRLSNTELQALTKI